MDAILLSPARLSPARSLTYEQFDMRPVERLRELIVYIASKSAHDKKFGVTTLYKVLWWAETCAFGLRRRPVSGASYIRHSQGAVPDGIDVLSEQMRECRDIGFSPQEYLGRIQHRVVALRRADLTAFSGQEIAVVCGVLDEHRRQRPKNVSKSSHGKMWEALPMGARMPYESIYVSQAKPTRYDLARTRELTRRFRWE
jgi:hypothetical protein